jgi:GNAT superfamily N-acetyltransferase
VVRPEWFIYNRPDGFDPLLSDGTTPTHPSTAESGDGAASAPGRWRWWSLCAGSILTLGKTTPPTGGDSPSDQLGRDEVSRIETWRTQLCTSAVVWSGSRFESEPGGVVAFSGSARADGNVMYCFGGEARDMLSRRIAESPRKGRPRLMMIAGEALGWTQVLIDDGWVCVGATPAMRLPIGKVDAGQADDPYVRRLTNSDMDDARSLFVQAYGADTIEGELMLPDAITSRNSTAVWGLEADGELKSVVVTSDVDDGTVIWSMSTPPQHQRRGYGRRLILAVMDRKRESGTQNVLLFSSPAGRSLYQQVGFEEIEHWQEWSRPRWVFGLT